MGVTIFPSGVVVSVSAGTTHATGDIVFSNSNGVSFGLDGSTITASVNAGTGGSGVVQWSAGSLSQTRTDITFGDSNGISFGLDTNGVITGTVGTNYLTTAMQSNRGSDFVAATAGFAGTNASGTIASNGVSISVADPSTGGGLTNIKVSAGTLSALRSDLTFGDSNGISFGLNTDGVITGTVRTNYQSAGAYLTTAALSQDSSKYAGTNGAITGGSITVNTSGVSVNLPAYLTTAMASNRGSDFVAATAGFNGTNASGTIASNSISVSVAAPIPIGTAVKAVASVGSTGTITRYAPEDHQHVGVAAFAVTNTGNTLGNTRSQVGTFFVAASGGITASQSTGAAGNDTVWLSVAAPVAQTNQTVGLYASSNTYLTSSGTVDARSLSFRGDKSISIGVSAGEVVFSVGAYLTTAMASNRATDFVAASAGFNGTNASGTIASNAISVSVAAQSNQTLGLYATSNTEGASSSSTFDARSLTFQGKGAASVGFSNGSLVIDAPSAAAGNVTFSAGVASAGLASIVFSNLNGVSFGLNGSTITASAAGGGGGIGAGISTGGNTAGSTGTVTTGNVIFVGSNAISLSQSTGAAGSNATITIDAPATSSLVGTGGLSVSTNGSTISVVPAYLSEYAPYDPQSILTNSTIGLNSLYFVPFDIPAALSAYRVNQFFSVGTTLSASNATATGQISNSMALYSRGVGASTDRISTFWSGSWLWTWSVSSNTAFNMSHPYGIANSTSVSQSNVGISNANASTYWQSSIAGFRMIPMPVSLTLTPGRYWAAFAGSSTTASTKYNIQLSVMQHTIGGQLAFQPMGTSSVAGNGSVFGPMAGAGTYSTTSGAFPATVALTNSDIRMGASILTFPYFNFSAYTTGVAIL